MNKASNSDEPARKSWWYVADCLRCPVIGTCLTMAEQRSLLKKAGISATDLDDYQVHGLLVQSGDGESNLARRVQRALDGKFRREIGLWGDYQEPALLSLWEEQLRCGQIDALLWVLATHPCLSKPALGKIFADVHMLMHRQGEAVRQELAQAVRLREEVEQLQDKLRTGWARHQELTQTVHALERECAELRRTLRAQEQPEQRDLLAPPRAQLEKAERLNTTQAAVIARLQAEKESLASELAAASSQNRSLQAEVERVLGTLSQEESACQDCPEYDLCGRRVLLVGGITRLKASYRGLVADAGGEFKHHNGGKSGGTRALEGAIGWADIVLCPVDVNSHHACLNVKAICKKMAKPYHMMASSGVSSVARVLAEVAALPGEPVPDPSCK
jgi:hypothetical protein